MTGQNLEIIKSNCPVVQKSFHVDCNGISIALKNMKPFIKILCYMKLLQEKLLSWLD